MGKPFTGRTMQDVSNDIEDQGRSKLGAQADTDAAADAAREASDKKRSELALKTGGEVDDRPKAMPGEGAAAFAGRMAEYRRKKQAAQSAALR